MKCKDYNIIKIRTYCDNIKKFHQNDYDTMQEHRERAYYFNHFLWELAEKLSGKDSDWWHNTYMFSARECFFEYLVYDENISTSYTDGWYTFYIPKEKDELFQWIKDNLKNPYKVVTKTYLPNIYTTVDKTYFRDEAIKFTSKIKAEYNLSTTPNLNV